MKLHVDPECPRKTGELQFSLDSWIDTAPFELLLGLEIIHAKDGEAYLTLPFRVKHANGGGVMHGGAMVTLADTAVAMAIKSLLPDGTVFATTELQMEFVSPVLEGLVHAKAWVVGPDGRSFQGFAQLLDDEGSVHASFRSTFRVARGQGFNE